MSIVGAIKRWFNMTFNINSQMRDEFDVVAVPLEEMMAIIGRCERAYNGKPDWEDEHIKTINFAETICSEVARLACMNIDVTVDGSARAKWLQEQIDAIKDNQLRGWVEHGTALGTVILKPNGRDIDVVYPSDMQVTATKNGDIDGVVFLDSIQENKDWFTRLEYHRFENGKYHISNRVYKGTKKGDLKSKVDIKKSPWKNLSDDVIAENVDKPLFGVFKTPQANNVVYDSPLGMPIFSSAIEELKDLDIAYSRNAKEVFDSKRTVLLDSDRLLATGGKLSGQNADVLIRDRGLPDFVKSVEGTGQGDIYHEINPTLNTDIRLRGLDALLSQIGFKIGFSNGYFVFNQKTGMVTATQVESDDRRTLQLINDVRNSIKSMMDGLVYALDKFADAYGLAPRGDYEVAYDFEDLTINTDEDRARWYGYVTAGQVPFWKYLTMYEGFSEEEAKELVKEAQTQAVENMALMGGFNA